MKSPRKTTAKNVTGGHTASHEWGLNIASEWVFTTASIAATANATTGPTNMASRKYHHKFRRTSDIARRPAAIASRPLTVRTMNVKRAVEYASNSIATRSVRSVSLISGVRAIYGHIG